MAVQKGIIKLKGQMGGISFYKSKSDGYLARSKGGVDKMRIKNDAAFVRTRENGVEFGASGSGGKLLRTALRSVILNSSDSRMISRLTQAMMRVIQTDAHNIRGQRKIMQGQVSKLTGFEFNNKAKLHTSLLATFTPSIDRVGGKLKINIDAFVPADSVASPQGATHFRFVIASAEVDFDNVKYVINTTQSQQLVIDHQIQPAQEFDVAVTAGSKLPLFLVFGIQFFQMVNGAYYPLQNGHYDANGIVAADNVLV